MCPLGYMKMFMVSCSITKVKQYLAKRYSDGGHRTVVGESVSQSEAAFSLEIIILLRKIITYIT